MCQPPRKSSCSLSALARSKTAARTVNRNSKSQCPAQVDFGKFTNRHGGQRSSQSSIPRMRSPSFGSSAQTQPSQTTTQNRSLLSLTARPSRPMRSSPLMGFFHARTTAVTTTAVTTARHRARRPARSLAPRHHSAHHHHSAFPHHHSAPRSTAHHAAHLSSSLIIIAGHSQT